MKTPSQWPLESVKVGDKVACPYKPAWGEGIVIDAQPLGTIRFKDSKDEMITFTHQQNSHGQSVSVKFTDGRTRTIVTPNTPLKVISEFENKKKK